MKKFKTIAIILGVLGILSGSYFGGAYVQKLKLENKQLKENQAYRDNLDKELAKKDSTISTILKRNISKRDLSDYLDTHDKSLKRWLDKKHDINLKKVQSIIKSELVFVNKDTTIVDLSPILEAIKKGEAQAKQPFTDSIANCMIVKGYILLDGEKLDLVINDREFKNTMTGVAYLQRQKWKLLFFNTRLFGKRKLEIILEDSCGTSHTIILDVSKR